MRPPTGELSAQHVSVDVDDDLSRGRDNRDSCVRHDPPLAHANQGVCAQHRMRAVLGGEFRLIRRGDVPLFSSDQVCRRLERSHDHGTVFAGKHSHQLEHSVVTPPRPDAAVEKSVAGAARIIGIERLLDTSADARELSTGRVQCHQAPHLVIVWRRYFRDSSDLVKGQPAVCECGSEHREFLECVARAHHLSTIPDVAPDVDRQPMRARPHADFRPRAVGVEVCAQLYEFRLAALIRRKHADALLKFDSADVLHWHIIANRCSLPRQDTDRMRRQLLAQITRTTTTDMRSTPWQCGRPVEGARILCSQMAIIAPPRIRIRDDERIGKGMEQRDERHPSPSHAR